MAKFSQRIGVESTDPVLQVGSMNDALRNSLWNYYLDVYDDSHKWVQFARFVAAYFAKTPIDETPKYNDSSRDWVKRYFMQLPWHEVYNFLEFTIDSHEDIIGYTPWQKDQTIKYANAILTREVAGYRFIQGVLTPITDIAEVAAVEEAVAATGKAGIAGAQIHIKTAIKLFGKKPDPDYRNAIKEAISAVESVAKVLSKETDRTLEPALEKLASKVSLHGALKSGFSKLYGFTSDASGIRHALMDQPTVGFAEAKYMIVSCSAFVNFLIEKADEANLLIKNEAS